MAKNTTLTGNVDFFQATRSLSDRVAEFFRCILEKKNINLEYDAKIKTLRESVENIENLAGSILADNMSVLKSATLEQIDTLEKQRADLIAEQATFEYTDADKSFKKALSKNPSADIVAEEVCKWFDNYGLNIRGTLFLDEICGTFGDKIYMKEFVRTSGTNALKVDANNALKNLYAVSYQHMVRVGTIKPAQIPELVREKYAPKKSKKSSK